MKSREVQLPLEEVPDTRGVTGDPHQSRAEPAPGTKPPGHRRLPRGSREAPGLCTSSAALSTLQAEFRLQVCSRTWKCEISKRRGVTAGEQVLHWGLEASSAHPGPTTGTPQRGFHSGARIRDKMLQLGDTLERAEAKLSHQITDILKNSDACFKKKTGFLLAGAARFIHFDLNAVAQDFRLYFIPGNVTVLEQHTVGEQAGCAQVWQS